MDAYQTVRGFGYGALAVLGAAVFGCAGMFSVDPRPEDFPDKRGFFTE
jgi:hypothetical protein